MAVVFMDGFDYYLTADLLKRWSAGSILVGGTTISPTYARPPAGQGIKCEAGNVAPLAKSFGSNYTQGLVGFAFLSSASMVSRPQLLMILDGGTEQISLRTSAGGVLTVTRGGTVLATGTTVLSADTWYYIELKFTIHASAGVVEVKLNGAAEIASTGSLNTRSTANTQWNGIQFVPQNQGSAAAQYDDVYVLDTSTGSNTTFLGPVRCVALQMAAPGNYTQWTSNGGSNVGNVSEDYEDGDTSFNQSATPNQIDSFAVEDLPGGSGSVFALQPVLVARQDGGAARQIAPLFRIASTDYVGASQTTGATYAFMTQIYDQSPATASAWTVAEVAGLEAGYKEIS